MASVTASLTELKSYTMLSISAVFMTISAVALILRVYVRGAMIRSFGWDDWLMLVTWVSVMRHLPLLITDFKSFCLP